MSDITITAESGQNFQMEILGPPNDPKTVLVSGVADRVAGFSTNFGRNDQSSVSFTPRSIPSGKQIALSLPGNGLQKFTEVGVTIVKNLGNSSQYKLELENYEGSQILKNRLGLAAPPSG